MMVSPFFHGFMGSGGRVGAACLLLLIYLSLKGWSLRRLISRLTRNPKRRYARVQFRELAGEIGVSHTRVRGCVDELVDAEFLEIRREGEEIYIMVTRKGERLSSTATNSNLILLISIALYLSTLYSVAITANLVLGKPIEPYTGLPLIVALLTTFVIALPRLYTTLLLRNLRKALTGQER